MLALLAVLAPGLLAAWPGTRGQGFEVPPNDGWVTDRAGILSDGEEQSLEALAESYRAGTGREIALLTLPDLGGRPIEDVALAVAREWKIGDRETSSGALLVVAQAERELRIEVGRGLEGTLTDSIAGRIIRDVIVPEFRAQRFYEGLRLGLEAIHAALGGDTAPIERRAPPTAAPLLNVLVLVFVLVMLAFRHRGRRGRSSLGGALPWILASQLGRGGRGGGGRIGGFSGGSFGGFGGGGGFSGGGASGRW